MCKYQFPTFKRRNLGEQHNGQVTGIVRALNSVLYFEKICDLERLNLVFNTGSKTNCNMLDNSIQLENEFLNLVVVSARMMHVEYIITLCKGALPFLYNLLLVVFLGTFHSTHAYRRSHYLYLLHLPDKMKIYSSDIDISRLYTYYIDSIFITYFYY